jgi:hypothetical protein
MDNPHQGYEKEENENKAEEVRILVKLANKAREDKNDIKYQILMHGAKELSGELEEYISELKNVPETKLFYYPYSNTLFPLMNRLGNKALEWFKNHTSQSKSLKDYEANNLHWIGIIYTKEDEESDPIILYTLFVDEEGLHMERQRALFINSILMPKEFYSFLQRMGLLLEDAVLLYGIEASSAYGTELMGFPQQFVERAGSWPLVVEKAQKL